MAYLKARQGPEAAAEFQKILDHRGVCLTAPECTLARLQLGRARALSGDNAGARTAYQDFLALWKDADPDVPILKEAKAEYAKLQYVGASVPLVQDPPRTTWGQPPRLSGGAKLRSSAGQTLSWTGRSGTRARAPAPTSNHASTKRDARAYMSLTCVAMYHLLPKGSITPPLRSP